MFGVIGDQILEFGVCEDACGPSPAGGLADQRYNGDAHPEGIASCGYAVVWQGIETNVDLVVEAKVIFPQRTTEEFYAAFGNALGPEEFCEPMTMFAVECEQKEMRIGDGLHHPRPQSQ